ncbi:MAG: metalloregulator ArsR/SmtB family transcription factor [Dehalococcoidia bacterium]|jgi:DNA-binding transcriptional ArsR family regulator
MAKKEAEEKTDEQAAIFAALADPTRLRLVKLLRRQRDYDALCVNALATILGVTQSAVSQHLRVLKAIGLVKGERRGYHIHYFINRESLEHCRDIISVALTIDEPGKERACESYCPIKEEKHGASP